MEELTNKGRGLTLKFENKKESYLYIEHYPVTLNPIERPQCIWKYVNRTVKTFAWDKSKAVSY